MPTMTCEVSVCDAVCVVSGGGCVESIVVEIIDCFSNRLCFVEYAVYVAGCGRKGVPAITRDVNVLVCGAAVKFVVRDTEVECTACGGKFVIVDCFSGG